MILLDDLLAATNGRLIGPALATTFSDFAYDSRQAEPAQLFVAVKSDKGDGHDYIAQAVERGVTAVLCQRPPDESMGVTTVVVSDTQTALRDYAAHIVRKSGVEVVGVTGSAGKTSTKEMIAAVLATRHEVFRNYGSYNGRYGLPIALGRLEPSHRIAVLEMACDGFGEIAELTRIAPPRVGVVTNVSANQIAFFGSLEAIAREDGALVEALPSDGLAVLNQHDSLTRALATFSRAPVAGFGFEPGAGLCATEIVSDLEGTHFWLVTPEGKQHVSLRLPGAHQASNALAALAVAQRYGIPLEEAIAALGELAPLSGRLQPLPGLNGSTVLDDTYSASPAPVLAALAFVRGLPAARVTRRIAILGDLNDLGRFAGEAYREIGAAAAGSVDLLITAGEGGQHIAAAAREAGMPPDAVLVTYTNKEAIRTASADLRPGDVVLVKGDTETRMEQVALALLADPERDGARLPRQTPGWEQVKLGLPSRPTWVEIDLDAIATNTRRVTEIIGPEVALMAVLKADAYGHGAIKVARTVLNNGASMLGVASLSEAGILRDAGISAPVLILGYTPAWQAREAILRDARVTIYDLDIARALDRAAADLDTTVRVHVKVDTGMGRLGLLPEQVGPFLEGLRDLGHLEIEGLFTHFSVADSGDKAYTLEQLATFRKVLARLKESGGLPRYIHAANSAGTLSVPEARFNLVRVGIALYGMDPSPEEPLPTGFEPALSWKSTVAQVKALPPGSSIGYGRTYVTRGEQRIAIIPVGYADGFRRAPQHWGEVLVKGQRAPIVGRISMDQAAIDVTHIADVRIGDEVVLIGRQGEERISAEDVGRQLGTINYEVVAAILARVPRVT
jgi:alanine racemase